MTVGELFSIGNATLMVEAEFLDGDISHGKFLHFAGDCQREAVFEEPITGHFEMSHLCPSNETIKFAEDEVEVRHDGA